MNDQATALERHAPQREWLVRCSDNAYQRSVCSVEANDGVVEIIGPHREITTLHGSEIISFRDALNAAIGQAATDVADR